MNLTSYEIKLAAKLLEVASEKFSNHSCNDFELVREVGLTSEEAYEINRRFVEWNDPDWQDDYSEEELRVEHAIAGDNGLMAYLSERLKSQLTEEGV
jgi:hypothetical protein